MSSTAWRTCATVPSSGAPRVSSIFIASITTSGAFFATTSPGCSLDAQDSFVEDYANDVKDADDPTLQVNIYVLLK
jgi:hypothetical protein